MLIVTNRKVNLEAITNGTGNEKSFGEERSDTLRFAQVERKPDDKPGDAWEVRLLKEEGESKALQDVCAADERSCVVYVNGFNRPFADTLDQGWTIQNLYAVEVVLFSWPSFIEHDKQNVDAHLQAYKQIRGIAKQSTAAFDSFLEKFSESMLRTSAKAKTVNLLIHSMGNYLLENYLLNPLHQGTETGRFTNIVLSQADVGSDRYRDWVAQIATGSTVYATINQNDETLALSSHVNGVSRLGNTLPSMGVAGMHYFDFTPGRGVEKEHKLWGKVWGKDEAVHDQNPAVKKFFAAVLTGSLIENMADFELVDPDTDLHRIKPA
jgi:esterase/lipase superfamily enzyme